VNHDFPLVSYFVTSYNYARFLPATLDSILAQEWPNIEIIVVDDASSDNSAQIIESYAARHPDVVKPILFGKNCGQSAAARAALAVCSGEFISPMSSDDIATPNRTREGVEYLRKNPEVMAAFSKVRQINEIGETIDSTKSAFNEPRLPDLRLRLLKGNMLCATAAVIRRSAFEHHTFNPALRAVEDFDMWLHILDEYEIARLDTVWVNYRIHGANISMADSQGLPFSAPYETVQVILSAISRWLATPDFVKRLGLDEASVKHGLARHCIALDRHYLGRPLLGIQKAYELILDAINKSPENGALRQTLAFIQYLIGDTTRAIGGKSIPLPDWKGPVVGFESLPLQFREEAASCTLGQLENNLGAGLAQTRQELSFLTWLNSQWLTTTEKDKIVPERMPDRNILCVILDARQNYAKEALQASLTSLFEQPIKPELFVQGFAEEEVIAKYSLKMIPADVPTAEFLSGILKSEQWIVQIQPGDIVDADGTLNILDHISRIEGKGLIYADEALLDADGIPSMPQIKPDFDIDHLRSRPYLGRFLIMRAAEFFNLGGLNEAKNEATFQDYAFRFAERHGQNAISHLAKLAFHGTFRPPIPLDLSRPVLVEHLSRSGIDAVVNAGLLPDSLRVCYQHAQTPLVSIIIPTKNQQPMLARCVETLTAQTTYTNYELLIVDNQSDEADSKAYIEGIEALNMPQLRVLHYDLPFNYSAVNNFAAREARGEYLVLLNNDTAILDGSWLDALLNHAQRSEVGIVGAKLLFPDGRIQHGGVILGLRGPADHPFIGEPMNATGYGGRLMIDQQYSAVTAACMMIRKSIFEEVGGLDEKAFKVSYNDIDLCLKVRQAGYSVIWTPYAQLMHVANVSQKAEDSAKQEAKQARFAAEQRTMYQRWMPQIKADPFYNPNFRLKGSGFELESNPVFRPKLPGLKKLLAHSGDFWGSGLYRMIAPATVLAEEGLIAGGCYREYFMPAEVAKIAPDVIVLQRQTSDEQIRGASDYRSYSNAKLIFELDDYLPNVPISNAHKKNLPPDLVRRLRKAMSICDRIVVSTDPLREAMLPFHDEIVVLPNYLPKKLWGAIPERTESDLKRKPRIGWAGGSSHTGDLRMVADVVRALADRVDWVFLGMKPEGVDEHITEFHVGVHLGEYPAKLAALDLDLALAPLEENQFNECKSNLRLLEYGICGYPVIATDVTPYRCGFPVTLVRNRFKDWVEAIQTKLEDRDALWQEGIALQRFVREGWMLEGENLLRWRDGWMLGD